VGWKVSVADLFCYTFIYKCMSHACIQLGICICVYMYIYVCIYVYMYIYKVAFLLCCSSARLRHRGVEGVGGRSLCYTFIYECMSHTCIHVLLFIYICKVCGSSLFFFSVSPPPWGGRCRWPSCSATTPSPSSLPSFCPPPTTTLHQPHGPRRYLHL